MIDLGKKENSSGASIPEAKHINKIFYPTLCINDIPLPITNSQVGDIITATVQLKVTRAGTEIEQYSSTPNKKIYKCDFKVLGIDFHDKKKIDIKSMNAAELDEMEKLEYAKMAKRKR